MVGGWNDEEGVGGGEVEGVSRLLNFTISLED